MLWQRLFASEDSDAGNHDLILGTAYASVLYFALHLIPRAVTVYLIPLVIMPFFALAISLRSREIDFGQPMFEDVPKKNASVYRQAILNLARPALCVGSLGLCAGLMRALAIDDPAIGSFVNALSMGASLITAVAFLVLWQFKSVRLNVVALFRIVFPVVITGFVLLPFLGGGYAQWLAAALHAAYSVAIMLMMIQCAQASRDHGTNPVFVYGFFGGVVYALHDAGFIGGTLAAQTSIPGLSPHAVVALGAGYLLGFMHFFGQGGFRTACALPPPSCPTSSSYRARIRMRRGPCGKTPKNQADPRRPSWRRAYLPRPHLQASGAHSRRVPAERPRNRSHGAHRAREDRGAHRRRAGDLREHRAHAFEAHLREARRSQETGAYRPRRLVRAGGERRDVLPKTLIETDGKTRKPDIFAKCRTENKHAI